MAPLRTARIELRADAAAAERIRLAAATSRKSVSAFVLDAANEAAEEVIAQQTTVVLTAEAFDSFYDWLDTPAEEVPALASLAMGRVQRGDLPLPVARGGPLAVPVILIARLAVDRRAQGAGVGAELLWDALTRGSAANALAAARAFVVDAIDGGAASFYEHFGFVRV